MIEPKDLMIGNYVNFNGNNKNLGIVTSIEVFMLKKDNVLRIDYYCNKSHRFEDIEPIPITEDWLLKLGFGINNWTDKGVCIYYGWEKDGILLETDKETSFLVLDGTPKELPGLKYVHQLQNLYYALTREELTIKN